MSTAAPAPSAPAAPAASAAHAAPAAPAPQAALHLLGPADLGLSESNSSLLQLLDLTDRFAEVTRRPIPKVPALRGKTVVLAFFEDSTRTRLSFDLAAKRLSADTLTFAAASSSLTKGESIRDTVETIAAMGVDAIVVRHANAGVPQQIARWLNDEVSVINAGDGAHQHPTQALQDAYTLCQHLNHNLPDNNLADRTQPENDPDRSQWSLAGKHIGLVGDIAYSRVARSNVAIYTALGARVTLIAPPTLLPPNLDGWPVEVCHDFDEVIDNLDVVGLLRLQSERMDEALIGPLHDYVLSYGLTKSRAARLAKHAVITHPGPVNRGIEVAGDVLDDAFGAQLNAQRDKGVATAGDNPQAHGSQAQHPQAQHPQALITRQVTHGVATRMAVLFRLLGENAPVENAPAESGPGENAPAADPPSAGQTASQT